MERPAPEIVIDINRRNPRRLRPLFQLRNMPGHLPGRRQNPCALRKLRIIDDIDRQQGDRALVRRAAVQIQCGRDSRFGR